MNLKLKILLDSNLLIITNMVTLTISLDNDVQFALDNLKLCTAS